MDKLLLNSKTQTTFNHFIVEPSHALLIEGPRGSGKTATANWLACELLNLNPESLDNYPYLLRLIPDEKGTIAIEAIRKLNHFLSLKVPTSKSKLERLILIDDADNMTLQAQNALLKNLEEPPAGSGFTLTTSNPTKLLPTVRSRLQVIRLIQPDRQQLEKLLRELGASKEAANQAIAISGGLPGLAVSIISDSSHQLVKAAELAKDILSKNKHERLVLINKIYQDKQLLKDTLAIIQHIARISLYSASGPQAKRWQSILEGAYNTEIEISKNVNAKLALTHFILNS